MRSPTPAAIRAARERAGLTQTQAAELVYSNLRTWQGWETEEGPGSRRMHPQVFEAFLLKAFHPELFEAFDALRQAKGRKKVA